MPSELLAVVGLWTVAFLVGRGIDRLGLWAINHKVARLPVDEHQVALIIHGQILVVSVFDGVSAIDVPDGYGGRDRYDLQDELLPTDDGRLLPVYR